MSLNLAIIFFRMSCLKMAAVLRLLLKRTVEFLHVNSLVSNAVDGLLPRYSVLIGYNLRFATTFHILLKVNLKMVFLT